MATIDPLRGALLLRNLPSFYEVNLKGMTAEVIEKKKFSLPRRESAIDLSVLFKNLSGGKEKEICIISLRIFFRASLKEGLRQGGERGLFLSWLASLALAWNGERGEEEEAEEEKIFGNGGRKRKGKKRPRNLRSDAEVRDSTNIRQSYSSFVRKNCLYENLCTIRNSDKKLYI